MSSPRWIIEAEGANLDEKLPMPTSAVHVHRDSHATRSDEAPRPPQSISGIFQDATNSMPQTSHPASCSDGSVSKGAPLAYQPPRASAETQARSV